MVGGAGLGPTGLRGAECVLVGSVGAQSWMRAGTRWRATTRGGERLDLVKLHPGLEIGPHMVKAITARATTLFMARAWLKPSPHSGRRVAHLAMACTACLEKADANVVTWLKRTPPQGFETGEEALMTNYAICCYYLC